MIDPYMNEVKRRMNYTPPPPVTYFIMSTLNTDRNEDFVPYAFGS